MKKLIMVILTIWITIAPIFVNGQTPPGKITGKVWDATQKPVNGATVVLHGVKDSIPLKYEVADANGNFVFNGLKTGLYRVYISAAGFAPYKSDTITINGKQPLVTVNDIVLQTVNVTLKEVSITGKKSYIEHKTDRTVVNVDALISNAGATALEVLEKSPGVLVDQNGGISLKGQQGVAIFIDDKPSYLSGAALADYLRSLPSSSLQQIEIMTNPPAKYDAAGNAGVINIKTKKTQVKGFNLGLSLSIGQARYTRTNNSLNFNYRKNKLNLFGSMDYTVRNSYADVAIFRRYKNTQGETTGTFNQDTYNHRQGHGGRFTIGADYYATPNTTYGIALTGLARYPYLPSTGTGNLLNAAGRLDSSVVSNNTEKGSFKNTALNLNYTHEFKKDGPDVNANLDYLNYATTNKQDFDNETFLPNGALISQSSLNGSLPSNIKILSAKADYGHPLGNGIKLEAGLKASYTQTDNIANYFNTTNGNSTPDYDKTNHFNYKENINAAYLNLNKDFKRLSIQAGLRLENTGSNGHQLGNVMKPDSAFNRNYTNLFPTFFMQYKLDTLGDNQIQLNYGRRIERPYYQDLNPFVTPFDKFTYYVGNPYLQPSFANKVELAYIFKNHITGTLSYSDTKNDTDETIQIVDGIYYSRPGNIGHKTVTSFSVDGDFEPTKWLSVNLNGEVTRIHSRGNFYTGMLDTKGTFVYGQGILQFKLQKGFNLQLDGSYQSGITNAQFVTGGKGALNAGASKNLSPKVTLKFSVTDILYTNINRGAINNLYLTDASYTNHGGTRSAQLTLSFRFGKAIAGQRKKKQTGADTEQGRVKN